MEDKIDVLSGNAIDENDKSAKIDYGTPRHSGRYPWGSGDTPYQRNEDFLSYVHKLRKDGVSQVDIARGMGINTSELRRKISAANSANRAYLSEEAMRLRDKGYSYTEIGRRLGKPDTSVRLLLDKELQRRNNATAANADILRGLVDKHDYIDVTSGTEMMLGISQLRMKNAVEILKNEGYSVHQIQVKQLGTGNQTTMKILCKPGTTLKDLKEHRADIKLPNTDDNYYSEDGGSTARKVEPPVKVNLDRIQIIYSEQGGVDRDGLVELRRGVEDLSLGNARYAQVRIATSNDMYIKGMAVYADDLPDGIDIRVNSNKSIKGGVEKALKKMKDDPDNPFGASIRTDEQLIRAQSHYIGKDGKEHQSALNIVSEEGNWQEWSKTLSSQFLSKQTPALAQRQLDLAKDVTKDEFKEIMDITNPTVKIQMLNEFADSCDSKAAHLRGASLPRQATKVILPVPELKDGEIYAPGYKDGESVILVRYPHAGVFEIPKLTVNNRNSIAKNMIGEAIDAVGINHKAAQQLSGADFDGDTALVIPVDNVKGIKTRDPLEGLKDFDPGMYERPGIGTMSSHQNQLEMGKTTNLITDMTVQGADWNEIERAVRHSMVVIDCKKHEYDWRQSEIDNGIQKLREKYQSSGASTIFSRANSEVKIPQRKLKAFSKMSDEEKERYFEGEQIWEDTGHQYSKPVTKTRVKKDEEGNTIKKANGKSETEKYYTGEWEKKGALSKVARMDLYDDARNLMSKPAESAPRIELIYANFANDMKELARQARKAARAEQDIEYDPEAKKTYEKEVASLKAQLNTAKKNSPIERQAQLIANAEVAAIIRDNPDIDKEHRKKMEGRHLQAVRDRLGAKKTTIFISDKEWEAINAGAVNKTTLKDIIKEADKDRLRQLATPRTRTGMSDAKVARAKSLLSRGYSQTDIADMLDVSVSTLIKGVGIANM